VKSEIVSSTGWELKREVLGWELKREVLFSRSIKIKRIHNESFKMRKYSKRLPKVKYSACLYNFQQSLNAFSDKNDIKLDFISDEIKSFESLLYKIYNYKRQFFLKHVKIKYIYRIENKNEDGIYKVYFDDCMLSFLKQCKFFNTYKNSLPRIIPWVDYVFSETLENKRSKIKEVDILFDKVCRPYFYGEM